MQSTYDYVLAVVRIKLLMLPNPSGFRRFIAKRPELNTQREVASASCEQQIQTKCAGMTDLLAVVLDVPVNLLISSESE